MNSWLGTGSRTVTALRLVSRHSRTPHHKLKPSTWSRESTTTLSLLVLSLFFSPHPTRVHRLWIRLIASSLLESDSQWRNPRHGRSARFYITLVHARQSFGKGREGKEMEEKSRILFPPFVTISIDRVKRLLGLLPTSANNNPRGKKRKGEREAPPPSLPPSPPPPSALQRTRAR